MTSPKPVHSTVQLTSKRLHLLLARADQVLLTVDFLEDLLVHQVIKAHGAIWVVLIDDCFALFEATAFVVDGILESFLARVCLASDDPEARQIGQGGTRGDRKESDRNKKEKRFLHSEINLKNKFQISSIVSIVDFLFPDLL